MPPVIDLSEGSSADIPSSPVIGRSASDSQELVAEDLGEFHATLGDEWSYAKTRHAAVTADKVHFKRLLETEPRRPIEFVDGYLDSATNTGLSKKHFYGALIYTRGDRVNADPCRRCLSAEDAIFPQCISLNGMASGACAADLWAGTQLECDNHNDKIRKITKTLEITTDHDNIIHTKPRRQSNRPATSQYSRAISPNVSTRASYQKQIRESISQPVAPIVNMFRSSPVVDSSTIDDSEDSDIVELIPRTYQTTNKVILSKKPKLQPVSLMTSLPTGSTKGSIRTKIPLIASPSPNNPSGNPRKRGRPRKRAASSIEEPSTESPAQTTITTQPASRRPRYDPPVRDDLTYLQGDFDYQTAEKCFEIGCDDISEAKATNRVKVGPYLLCRFAVEMNSMWAIRIAAARWANGY